MTGGNEPTQFAWDFLAFCLGVGPLLAANPPFFPFGCRCLLSRIGRRWKKLYWKYIYDSSFIPAKTGITWTSVVFNFSCLFVEPLRSLKGHVGHCPSPLLSQPWAEYHLSVTLLKLYKMTTRIVINSVTLIATVLLR